jgi:CPA2 family monovalent cation:H+ antiporter-2
MHEIEISLLRDLVVVFGCAAPVVYLFHQFKQSPIVGFVITGAIVGPYGLSLINNTDSVRTLATVGVMILLFSLGLEFSLKKLMETRVAVLVAGPLQILGTMAVVLIITWSIGIPLNSGFIYGMLIGLSSTAVFMKMLAERRETDSIHGRIGLGIAIFQDLCTIPFLIAISLLAAERASFASISFALARSVALIALVLIAARYLFPILLRGILQTRSKELFLATSIFMFLGTAYVTANAGVSLGLGSFLAGLVLSESEYGHHIFAEVRPFRDSLNSLFFISIGMLVNPGFIFSNAGWILGITAAIVFGKILIITGAVMACRISLQPALLAGAALCQVGEFSFILLQTAEGLGIISVGPYQIILACSVISMLMTPVLFSIFRNLISRYLRNWNPRILPGRFPEATPREFDYLKDHVIICGFGLSGRNIASVLKANRIPYIIIDMNEQRVRESRKAGEPIMFGDCTSSHILEMAGIRQSRVIVFVISDPFATRLAIAAVRDISRDIVVLTRTKQVEDMDVLWDQGSTEVIAEEFEATLELMTRILRVYNAPRAMVAAEIKSIRDQRFGIFRERATTVPRIRLSTDLDIYTETWQVPADCTWNGATIEETRLRGETGVLILGIVRANQTLNNPDAKEAIYNGDLLVLSGTKDQLKKAILMLSRGRNLVQDEITGGDSKQSDAGNHATNQTDNML